MTLEKTKNRTLIAPNGATMGISSRSEIQELTAESFTEYQELFLRMRDNLEQLYAIVQEGVILNQVLQLTSQRSFMDKTMSRVARDSNFRNSMAKWLHGEHTSYSSWVSNVGWATIIMDYFSREQIPENLEAINEAVASTQDLTEIAQNPRELYESLRGGVKVASFRKDHLLADNL